MRTDTHTDTQKWKQYIRQFHSVHLAVIITIAYNSAYVQTETLNSTFARQAVVVYFDAERWVLM